MDDEEFLYGAEEETTPAPPAPARAPPPARELTPPIFDDDEDEPPSKNGTAHEQSALNESHEVDGEPEGEEEGEEEEEEEEDSDSVRNATLSYSQCIFSLCWILMREFDTCRTWKLFSKRQQGVLIFGKIL